MSDNPKKIVPCCGSGEKNLRYEMLEDNFNACRYKGRTVKSRPNILEVGYEIREFSDEEGGRLALRVNFVEIERKNIGKWDLVGKVEATSDHKEIIPLSTIPIPHRFYTEDTICACCRSATRHRKNMYILQDTVTKAYVQVGGGCLSAFTKGELSQYDATRWCEYLHYLENDATQLPRQKKILTRYYKKNLMLRYVCEILRHPALLGDILEQPNNVDLLIDKLVDYYDAMNDCFPKKMTAYAEKIKEEIEKAGFNAERAEIENEVREFCTWWNEEAQKEGNSIPKLARIEKRSGRNQEQEQYIDRIVLGDIISMCLARENIKEIPARYMQECFMRRLVERKTRELKAEKKKTKEDASDITIKCEKITEFRMGIGADINVLYRMRLSNGKEYLIMRYKD